MAAWGVMATIPSPTRKFLVIADSSPECRVALRFAARRAEHTSGHVTILRVITPGDFQHWMAVEQRMREEAFEEAENLVHELAGEVNDATGCIPEVLVREGKVREEILKLLEEDRDIAILVLGSATNKEGPGPLVSLLAKDATGAFPIPVTIVPGTLTDDAIDVLA